MNPRRWRFTATVLFVLASPVAHASQMLNWPDYMGRIWFRIGVTSEGRLSFGLAGDLIPASAGIEFSPRSELGLVRVFVVAKGGYPPPQACSVFLGGSAGAVAAFGPGQPLHFGLRLGAHVEHTPMADAASPNSSSARLAEELSYRFSWLRGAGLLHDGGVALGAHWAPGGYCQTD